MTGRLTEEERELYRRLADELLPATDAFPSASVAGVSAEVLDQILGWRPDLAPDLLRALASARNRAPGEGLAWLEAHDVPAYQALRHAALGAYYLNPAVRRAMRYSGQESRPVLAGKLRTT